MSKHSDINFITRVKTNPHHKFEKIPSGTYKAISVEGNYIIVSGKYRGRPIYWESVIAIQHDRKEKDIREVTI